MEELSMYFMLSHWNYVGTDLQELFKMLQSVLSLNVILLSIQMWLPRVISSAGWIWASSVSRWRNPPAHTHLVRRLIHLR